MDKWRGDGRFAVVGGLDEEIAPVPWPPGVALPDLVARPWVLPAVYEQLCSSGVVGDLRPAVPVFIQFEGIDFDDDAAEEKLDTFVQRVQQIVHQHGGNLLQIPVGDKGAYMHAVMGAPVAHEDDPARALRAALSLRELPVGLPYLLPLRIGVARGEVWSGVCGSPEHRCYTVMGGDVNLSARLMVAAQPGQILAARSVSDTPDFILVYLGEKRYKGFADPVPTYEVRGEQLHQERLFTGALIGREAELDRLIAAAQPLFQGREGAVLLYGDAGMGKSHLVYALRHALGERVTWFTGQADPVMREPLNPFVYWLKRYANQSSEVDAEENRRRLESCLQELYDDLANVASAAAVRQELLSTHSFLGALLGLHWPDSLYAHLDDPRLRYQNTLFALVTLIRAESLRRPLVLVLEDAHWLDDNSQEVLTALSRTMAGYPILLLIVSRYRDDGTHPDFALDGRLPTMDLDLGPLTRESVGALAQAILGGPVHDELQHVLASRSQSNPFFVQQLLRYFQENALLTQVGDSPTWALREATTELPTSITAVLVARLDRLPAKVRTVVKTAAVLGREFDVRLLAQVLQSDVVPELHVGEQEQVWSALDNLRYTFQSILLRDAAYGMQLRAQLREVHRLTAESLEAIHAQDVVEGETEPLAPHYGKVAHHYEAAYLHGLEAQRFPALAYLEKAGQQAARSFANAAAVDFFSRALRLLEQGEETRRWALLLRREAVYHLLGEREAQLADLKGLQTLAAAGQHPEERAKVALRWAKYSNATGDLAQAVTQAEAAVIAAQEAGRRGLEAEAQLTWGETFIRQGDYPSASEHLGHALALARAIGRADLEAQALRQTGNVALMQGDYAMAGGWYEQVLAICRAIGDREGEGRVLGNLGLVAGGGGDYTAARGWQEQALTIYRAIGSREGEAWTLNTLGEVAQKIGDYQRAHQLHKQALTIGRAIGDRRTEGLALNSLGIIAFYQGDYAAARGWYEQALAVYRGTGDRRGESYALNNLGVVASGQGDYVAACAWYEQALVIYQFIGDREGEGVALDNLGAALLNVGDTVRAHDYLLRALAVERETANPMVEGWTLNNMGAVLLAQGETAQAQEYFQRALALRQELNRPAYVAEDLAGLAQAALAQGNPEVARAYAGQMWPILEGNPTLEGAEHPMRAILGLVQVLVALNDPRAATLLARTCSHLQERAERIPDESTRSSFLKNVPAHRRLVELAQQQASQ